MGTLYIPIPLLKFYEEGAIDSLESFGIPIPPHPQHNRYPTPSELRTILASFEDYQVEYFVGPSAWQATIAHSANSEWTSIVVKNYSAAEDTPHDFYFAKGWPDLVIKVVQRIVQTCGPFVVLQDDGELLAVVIEEETSSQ